MGFFSDFVDNAVGSAQSFVAAPLKTISDAPPGVKLTAAALATGGAAYLLAPSSIVGSGVASGLAAINSAGVATYGAIAGGAAALGTTIGGTTATVVAAKEAKEAIDSMPRNNNNPPPAPVSAPVPATVSSPVEGNKDSSLPLLLAGVGLLSALI